MLTHQFCFSSNPFRFLSLHIFEARKPKIFIFFYLILFFFRRRLNALQRCENCWKTNFPLFFISQKQQPRHPQQPLELRRRGSGRRWRVERRTAPRKSVGIKNRTAGFDWHLLSIVATRPLQPCLHTCCYFSMATCTVKNHLHVFFNKPFKMALTMRLRKGLKSNFCPNSKHKPF